MRRKSFCILIMLTFLGIASIPANLDAQNNAGQAGDQPNDVEARRVGAQLAGQIENSVRDHCKYNPNEINLKRIRKTNDCMEKAIDIHHKRTELNESLRVAARAEAEIQAPSPIIHLAQEPAPPPSSGGGQAQAPTQQAPVTGSTQRFYGGSLGATPTTCGPGNGNGINSNLIRVHRSVMTPHTAADDFGYRLGRRFIVYQVTIENGSPDNQFMLHDISVDFSQYFGKNSGTYAFNASSQDLTLLRGVPEKGQDRDPRNLLLHTLQGIGSVAGAISGLTSFADVMGPAVAVFNGSFLQGYTTISPDHTSTQLNRLSDSAFIANTVIDKQRAKTIAVFVPADQILSHDEQKDFRKDPNAFLGFRLKNGTQSGILNSADVCVDGAFIQEVATKAPTLATAVLAKDPAPAPNLNTVITVNGSNLVTGDTEVVLGTGATAPSFPVLTTDGTTGTAQVNLPSDYANGTTTATLRSKANPALTSGTGVKITISPN